MVIIKTNSISYEFVVNNTIMVAANKLKTIIIIDKHIQICGTQVLEIYII